MRSLFFAFIVTMISPLAVGAQIRDLHEMQARAMTRVPVSPLVEVGTLENYSDFFTGGSFELGLKLKLPSARTESANDLPLCPGQEAAARQGYRLVVGPMLVEIDRAVLVLARACRNLVDGRSQARVRETMVFFRQNSHDQWVIRDVDQRRERDASPPVLVTQSVIGDSWSLAFWFLAGAAGIALVLARQRLGAERLLAALMTPRRGRVAAVALAREQGGGEGMVALPIVGGWAVALTIGCAWIFLAALAQPDAWNVSTAIRAALEVSGAACILSVLHTLLLRPLPYRGVLVSTLLGALVGWLAGMLSQSIPGMTTNSAIVGGALYGAFVGIAALSRNAASRKERAEPSALATHSVAGGAGAPRRT